MTNKQKAIVGVLNDIILHVLLFQDDMLNREPIKNDVSDFCEIIKAGLCCLEELDKE